MTLRTAVEYVAAAYLVVWVLVLVYMLLIGQKVQRLDAELDRLERALDERDAAQAGLGETPAPR